MCTKTMRLAAMLLLICMLLIGCNQGDAHNGTTDYTTGDEKPSSNEQENDAYLQIPLRECTGYVRKYYGLRDSSVALLIKFYENWEHTPDGKGGYLLTRDGVEIGSIEAGEASDLEQWIPVAQTEAFPSRVRTIEYIEKTGTGETLRFRHRFCYHYSDCGEDRLMTVTVAYGELDVYAQVAMRGELEYREHHSDPMYGQLSHLQEKPILVLGNSFVNSSGIGRIYNEIAMNSGKTQRMTAISRGYATVRTYAEDPYWLERIASGEWSAVFMCGFYGNENTALGIIKKACDVSKTQLIVFPAHNENSVWVKSAMTAYPDLLCVDWKREIDLLIDDGRSKWDFCIDDEHAHSNEVAGYVGAMMIWRAIYGEMPKVQLYSSIDQLYCQSILGTYMIRPTFEVMSTSRVNFLD